MVIEVNKDIDRYQESVAMGLTATFMQYNMGMHIVSTRYLKCPHCKTRTWCKKVMTKE